MKLSKRQREVRRKNYNFPLLIYLLIFFLATGLNHGAVDHMDCLCPPLSLSGELINLAMYCERIRRRFWPEWFVDMEDLCYDDTTDGSDSKHLDLGLYSHTNSFQDNTHSHTSHTHTPQEPPSPVSDPTGHSLYDSDMDTECSEIDQLKC